VANTSISANQLIEERLTHHLETIERVLRVDCLTYVGPIIFGVDDAIRDAVEAIPRKRDKLALILETAGGFAETARRIADVLRHHYGTVDFVVPGFAMSAGTVLVMSGDAIHMDYYSVLGPIDPQTEDQDGKPIPALGYLIRYEDLLEKAKNGQISTAEMEVLLNFDQTRLYAYEQARDLSRTLLEEWLVRYKFKDWEVTEDRGIQVTEAMKRERAKEIADALNEPRRWNSHGIGINMERLKRDLKLKIDDFGENSRLNDAIRRYHRLLLDYTVKMNQTGVIHTKQGYMPIF
jgi:ClpP class serine protease